MFNLKTYIFPFHIPDSKKYAHIWWVPDVAMSKTLDDFSNSLSPENFSSSFKKHCRERFLDRGMRPVDTGGGGGGGGGVGERKEWDKLQVIVGGGGGGGGGGNDDGVWELWDEYDKSEVLCNDDGGGGGGGGTEGVEDFKTSKDFVVCFKGEPIGSGIFGIEEK